MPQEVGPRRRDNQASHRTVEFCFEKIEKFKRKKDNRDKAESLKEKDKEKEDANI